MQIVIPEELTGSTEYAAGSQLTKSLSEMADVFAKQSAQSAQRNRQMDETVGVMQDSNYINKVYGDTVTQTQGMTAFEIRQRAESGYDLMNDVAPKMLDERRGEITNPIRRSLFDQARQKAEYQAREKVDAIAAYKMKMEARDALDTFSANAVGDAVGYIEPSTPFSSDPDAHAEAVAADKRRHMEGVYFGVQANIAARVARGDITQEEAKARDTDFLKRVALGLTDRNEARMWVDGHRSSMTSLDYLNVNAELQQKYLDEDALDLAASVKSRHVDYPADPSHEDGMLKSSLELWREAIQEATSPDFGKGYDAGAIKRARESVIRSYANMRDQYRDNLPQVLGGLSADIMSRKMAPQEMMKDSRFLSLNYPEKRLVSRYAEAVLRADAAEAAQTGDMDMYQRQEHWLKQKKEAVQKEGEILTRMARGGYTPANYPAEILHDLSGTDNPQILNQFSQATQTFSLAQDAHDLKAGLCAFADAADDGVLDGAGSDQNLASRGALQKELVDRYRTDETFRGEKVEKWVTAKVQAKAKAAVGQLLDSLVFGTG